MASNLNRLRICAEHSNTEPQQDFRTASDDGRVEAYFKDLETHLVGHIRHADYVVGCVAWLTSKPILAALATIKGASLVIQKEDWLRPDADCGQGWKSNLRSMYGALPAALSRYDLGLRGTVLRMMSAGGDPTIEAVRCVGAHNRDRRPAFPRSHHKFVVFCRHVGDPPPLDEEEAGWHWPDYKPYAVWTGSFNFTQNATHSFENAVLLRHPEIVTAYFREYAQVAALSEPLDWDDDWCCPEWRIGT